MCQTYQLKRIIKNVNKPNTRDAYRLTLLRHYSSYGFLFLQVCKTNVTYEQYLSQKLYFELI